jgi:hypothetical protein
LTAVSPATLRCKSGCNVGFFFQRGELARSYELRMTFFFATANFGELRELRANFANFFGSFLKQE